jgi:hypothetical protein
MKKTFSFILIVFLYTIKVNAQYSVKFQEPKTPEAYQFEKYGNQEISQYNGRHSTAVPLYTIKHGDIELPLSLNYSANGIRVDEEASRFGLGWYFGTGMITQITQGKDDFRPDHELKTPNYFDTAYPQFAIDPYPLNPFVYGNTPDPFDPQRQILQLGDVTNAESYSIVKVQSENELNYTLFPSTSLTGTLTNYNNLFSNNHGLDIEKDLFQANFFGHSILYYYEGVPNIRVLNNDKYKIQLTEYTDSNENKIKWTITTPDGIIYEFDEMLEITQYSSPNGPLLTGILNSQNSGYDTSISLDTAYLNHKSSKVWKITKITDTKGNEVIFNYEELPEIISSNSTSGKVSFVDNHYYMNTLNVNSGQYLFGPTNVSESLPYDNSQPDTEFFNTTESLQVRVYKSSSQTKRAKSILSSIDFGNANLEFVSSSRVDIPFDKRITSINVKYNSNLIENITFDQSYFNPNHNDNEQKRLKLDKVIINNREYEFEYITDTLPDKNTLSYDYWGYYNGMNNTSVANDPFRMFENTNHINSILTDLIPNIDGKANRSAHPIHSQAGMLKKIKFPTRGISEFFYELNTFDNYFYPNYDNKLNIDVLTKTYGTDYSQTESKGNGLRIKKIVSYTRSGNVAKTRKFTYQGGKHIVPIVYYNTDPLDNYNLNVDPYYYLQGEAFERGHNTGSKITAYFNNAYQSSPLANGEGIGYDKVIVEDIDFMSHTNGKIVSSYVNVPDKSARQVFGQGSSMPQEYYDSFGSSIRAGDIDNGTLMLREVYNNSDKPELREYFTYRSIVPYSGTSDWCYNVRLNTIGLWAWTDVIGIPPQLAPRFHVHSLFYYYPIKQPKTLLKSKKTVNYFKGGHTIQTLEEYDYNNHYSLINKKVKDQSGNTIQEQITDYPSDSPITGNNYTSSPFPTNNLVLNPNSITVKENGVISKIYDYDYSNNYTQLDGLSELPKGSSAIGEKKTISYNSYDNYGNILEFKENEGINTTIIWGYDKRYPIAKLENVTNSQISTYLSNLQNLSDADNDRTIGYSGNEGILRQALDDLRISFPDAMVTTYTYDPLIGITSITNPRAETIYYHYDEFNKLKFIKDKDGNILSENQYSYRPQN